MIDYKMKIAELIAGAADMDAAEVCSMIEVPSDEKMGDFAFPCFKLAKVFRKAPPLIAQEIAEKIADNEMFEKVEPVNAYLNMFVSREGLFPAPREIKFRCSCPDWAYMCKHVAAVLYGVGVLFDRDPLLFFGLRGIDVDELVRKSVEERLETMLSNAGSRTSRTLDDSVFGAFGVLDRK